MTPYAERSKTYDFLIKLAVCCAFALPAGRAYAQGRILSEKELDAIVDTKLGDCSAQLASPASIIPTRNAREFSEARIAKTLHGMWRGGVVGDDKDVSVDYFWIFDTKRGEALIIAQRTGKQTMSDLKPLAKAPKFSFLMCAHEGYFPSKSTSQIQEFVKVSDSIEDAPRILRQATGLNLKKAHPTLSDLWQGLVDIKYFEGLPAVAFAGGFFKPVHIGRVKNEVGPAQLSLKWDAQYYGGGSTSIKFTKGVPIKGIEFGQFVGTSTRLGDFIVASPGNGRPWKVEASGGGNYDLGFDKVVLGPLQ